MKCPNPGCRCVFVFALPEDHDPVLEPTCPACGRKEPFEQFDAGVVDGDAAAVAQFLTDVVDGPFAHLTETGREALGRKAGDR